MVIQLHYMIPLICSLQENLKVILITAHSFIKVVEVMRQNACPLAFCVQNVAVYAYNKQNCDEIRWGVNSNKSPPLFSISDKFCCYIICIMLQYIENTETQN